MQRRPRGNISRRALLSGTVATASAIACPTILRAQTDTLRFGLTPVFLSNDLDLLSSLQQYLSSTIRMPVELVSRRTYQEVTALLLTGQVHAAWICGYPFVQFRSSLDLVATPVWRGKPLYQSYLIAATDRVVEDWMGLKGDVHAFSDPDSNSGYLVTEALLAEHRLRVETFFSHSFFTYGHRNVIRAVSQGLAQSGSVDGYVWEVMRRLEPDLVAQTKIVQRSEWLGFPPIAVSKTLSSDVKTIKLRAALLGMKENPQGESILDMLQLDGFSVEDASLFDTIAAKMVIARSAT